MLEAWKDDMANRNGNDQWNTTRTPRIREVEPGIDSSGERARLDLSEETYNRALRDVAIEELRVVRNRYLEHQDPVRCAVGISLVLRNFARDVFGEDRINRLRRVAWLNFLLRTSNEQVLRPDFIETMSAALFGDPVGVELPSDCSFWFETAERWIAFQAHRRPVSTCATSLGANL